MARLRRGGVSGRMTGMNKKTYNRDIDFNGKTLHVVEL